MIPRGPVMKLRAGPVQARASSTSSSSLVTNRTRTWVWVRQARVQEEPTPPGSVAAAVEPVGRDGPRAHPAGRAAGRGRRAARGRVRDPSRRGDRDRPAVVARSADRLDLQPAAGLGAEAAERGAGDSGDHEQTRPRSTTRSVAASISSSTVPSVRATSPRPPPVHNSSGTRRSAATLLGRSGRPSGPYAGQGRVSVGPGRGERRPSSRPELVRRRGQHQRPTADGGDVHRPGRREGNPAQDPARIQVAHEHAAGPGHRPLRRRTAAGPGRRRVHVAGGRARGRAGRRGHRRAVRSTRPGDRATTGSPDTAGVERESAPARPGRPCVRSPCPGDPPR